MLMMADFRKLRQRKSTERNDEKCCRSAKSKDAIWRQDCIFVKNLSMQSLWQDWQEDKTTRRTVEEAEEGVVWWVWLRILLKSSNRPKDQQAEPRAVSFRSKSGVQGRFWFEPRRQTGCNKEYEKANLDMHKNTPRCVSSKGERWKVWSTPNTRMKDVNNSWWQSLNMGVVEVWS